MGSQLQLQCLINNKAEEDAKKIAEEKEKNIGASLIKEKVILAKCELREHLTKTKAKEK